MALLRIPGVDDVTFLVEDDDRGRSDAALGRGRVELGIVLRVVEIGRPVQYPDVVLVVHVESRYAAHPPFAGQWDLRPVRIEAVGGRLSTG